MKNNFEKNNNKNLSRNGMIKKITNIKSVKTQFNKVNIIYRNKDRFNLLSPKANKTSFNFYNNVNSKKIISAKKLKHDLLFDSDYSPFISKNSRYFNSEYPLTGLSSPKIIKTEIKYKKILSASPNKMNFSENRTKSTTSKNTKSNKIHFDSAFKNKDNIILLSKKRCQSNICYNNKSYNHLLKSSYSEFRRENLLAFLEKTRNIRKEKIKNLDLQNKIQSESELNKGKINLIIKDNEKYIKSLSLLDKYNKSFSNYLKYLEIEKNKVSLLSEELNRQKIQLEMTVEKINNKINKLKIKKTKYNNIKELFLLVKYGSDIIKNKDKKKEYSISKTDNNENKKQNININIKRLSTIFNPNIFSKNKENNKKYMYKKSYSINKMNSGNLNINTTKEKGKKKYIKTTKTILNDLNENNIFENSYEFKHIISNLENIIINNLNYLNNQRNVIVNLKKSLNQIKNYNEGIDNNIILSKIKMLDFVKKENNKLKIKLESIIKISIIRENFKNKIENKLITFLNDINKEINLEEKLNINNLFDKLNIDSTIFLNKMHISKVLYMIKIIEFIILFLNDLKNRYLNDPKLEKDYINITNLFEKIKTRKLHELIKKQIKQNLEEKKINIIKKAGKIRFLSSRKYYYKNKNNHKSHSKKTIKKRNNSNNKYEQWVFYD